MQDKEHQLTINLSLEMYLFSYHSIETIFVGTPKEQSLCNASTIPTMYMTTEYTCMYVCTKFKINISKKGYFYFSFLIHQNWF